MRSRKMFLGLGVATAMLFAAGAASAGEIRIAAADTAVFPDARVEHSDLDKTRGQGLDQAPPSGDQGGLAVILWDEMPRSNGSGASPAAAVNGAAVSSTVNGAAY